MCVFIIDTDIKWTEVISAELLHTLGNFTAMQPESY
jgi:hypothetical protein